MNKIKTNTLYFDLMERLDTALQRGQVSTDLERKVKSRARIYYAINEAVKYFVTKADVPLNALAGYRPTKLYHLQKTDVADYDGLAVYTWPEVANQSRPDAGLLRLNLDGKAFEPEFTNDPNLLSRRITSLQNQAENTLMYGPAHQNAVVDISGTKIYVPADVVPKAEVIIDPDGITTESLARGKAKLVVTGAATADNDLTIENDNPDVDVTVTVKDGDTKEEVASKIVDAINASIAVKLTAVLFADEVWLYTTDTGPSAVASVTATPGSTGVTFEESSVTLNPEETKEIPIDETHQEIIAMAAFNQMVNNVAFVGSQSAESEARGDGD